MELRDYQIEIAEKTADIVRRLGICYIAAEVRTGKTLMALEATKILNATNVLFLTKLKAIPSIQADYDNFGYTYNITIINDESLHTVTGDFDLVIHDEHHRFGAFPKPSKGATEFKKRFQDLPMIFLSGTPTPESFSQIYHQFWVSAKSPFAHFRNFYAWAKTYCKIYQINYGYGMVNQYDKANYEQIETIINPYFINFTQKQAGFKTEVSENILTVKMSATTYKLTEQLKKDLVIEGNNEVILADTAVKLLSKCHQLYSGTIKFESGNSQTIDKSKAEFIKQHFAGHKIGIFYKFKQELVLLREVFGDNLAEDLQEFNDTNKNVALQIQSGREGISLAAAKYLVYYNIDFSATSYWQSRDRMTTMNRLLNDVYYVFTEGGIEQYIYKQVQKKKTYTSRHFLKDAGIRIPTASNIVL